MSILLPNRTDTALAHLASTVVAQQVPGLTAASVSVRNTGSVLNNFKPHVEFTGSPAAVREAYAAMQMLLGNKVEVASPYTSRLPIYSGGL